jgi:glucose/arabinose dehydrogenase
MPVRLACVLLPGVVLVPSVAFLLAAGPSAPGRANAPPPPACSREAGLKLPEGFCAVVVAKDLGAVRQIAVAPNGDVFAATSGGNGGVIQLRDTDGDGVADRQQAVYADGGTGIAVRGGYLWLGMPDQIVRWRLAEGHFGPLGEPEVMVRGLPTGGHSAKTFAFLGGDTLIVNIGSQTNSCQESDRSYRSPGRDPCRELETRAGLWRFSASKPGQRQSDGVRFATGLRNAMALGVEPVTGKLYAAPHGRDQLAANWGFSDAQNAELPSEEFMQVEPGDDFGWPYCYYDHQQKKKVLAPEYGGDGKEVGRCASKKHPVIGFPGHWAPMAIVFSGGTQFPERYRHGAFIAFHGSWNRAPLPQAGYRVAFAPFTAQGRPTGEYETFATATEGPTALRTAGVAMGPDGSLYIGSERGGVIWRVMAAR